MGHVTVHVFRPGKTSPQLDRRGRQGTSRTGTFRAGAGPTARQGTTRGMSVAELRSRRARCAALAAVLVLVTACSDDPPAPAPIEAAPPTTSATPSATPSPSGPPSMPAEAKGISRKAAVPFVRHFVDVLNQAALDGSTTWLDKRSPACKACRAIVELIDEVYARGGRIVTEGWDIKAAQVLRTGSGPTQVRITVRSAPQTFRVPGEKPQRFSGGVSVKTFTLEPSRAGWHVAHLDQT
jgi:hypothetical protein